MGATDSSTEQVPVIIHASQVLLWVFHPIRSGREMVADVLAHATADVDTVLLDPCCCVSNFAPNSILHQAVDLADVPR